MLPRTPLRSLSHSWAATTAESTAACSRRNGDDPLLLRLGKSNLPRRSGRRAVPRGSSTARGAKPPEHIGGVDFGTPYIHQTPAGSLVSTGRRPGRVGRRADSVLRPEYTPCLSDTSADDSIDSVRGVGNGGILIGKIRELQRQLDAVEKEKSDMKMQIEALKAGKQPASGSAAGHALEPREKPATGVDARLDELETSRRSLDFRNDDDDEAGVEHGVSQNLDVECEGNNELLASIPASQSMSDDQMIQAMSKITHGVHQLEGALRRHLSSSTRSTSSSSSGTGEAFTLTGSSDQAGHLHQLGSSNSSSGDDPMARSGSSLTSSGSPATWFAGTGRRRGGLD